MRFFDFLDDYDEMDREDCEREDCHCEPKRRPECECRCKKECHCKLDCRPKCECRPKPECRPERECHCKKTLCCPEPHHRKCFPWDEEPDCRPRCKCGCYPCQRPETVALGGRVTGAGDPVAGLVIAYVLDSRTHITTTGADGRYAFKAPRGTQVIITPQVGVGVTATPSYYELEAHRDRMDLDFVLTPVV